MKTKDPPVHPPRESDGGITIHNRLHAGHCYQSAVDEVLRIALQGLPGAWDVSIYAIGRAWFRIDVIAPRGAIWSMSIPVHQGPRADDLAGMVQAACVRLSQLTPSDTRTEMVGDEVARSSPRDAAGGISK